MRDQDRLVDGEQRYRILVEGSIQGIIVHRNDRILLANQAMADILGFDGPDTLYGLDTIDDYVHPDDLARTRGYRAARLRGEAVPNDYELRIIRADGRQRWVNCRATMVDWDDKPAFQVVFFDVTERRRAEAALRESEARLANAQRIAHLGNWVRDYVNDSLEWSDEVFRIFGHPPQAFVPRKADFADAIHPDDRAADAAALRHAIETHSLYRNDLRIIRPDGTVRWVHQQGEVDYDDAGDPSRTFGTIQDITERKRAEDLVRQSRDAAEAANRAKSAFLSSMSHELRTPLNAVLGFGQVLAGDTINPLSPDQREAVEHIVGGGEHLLSLISDVLELSRIEAESPAVSLAPLDTAEVLQATMKLAGGMGEKANVTIRLAECDPGLPPVLADQRRLSQALLNLITNAVKYNRPGGQVHIACEMAGEARLRFSVADTGYGILPEHKAKLFEPFDRLGQENSDIEGTGIGLTITKQLVEAMGGRIDCVSIEGKGSLFWIDLPAANPANPPSVKRKAVPPAVDRPAHCRKVLYVEDHDVSMMLMEAFLDTVPTASLIKAETAERGIELAQADPPDIILMDLGLPGIGGIEARRKLRALEPTRQIPVVAVTADATPETAQRCRAAGFEDLATKPLNLARLTHILDAHAQR